MQVELLCIYGADPEQRNANDQTPAQVARQDGFVSFCIIIQYKFILVRTFYYHHQIDLLHFYKIKNEARRRYLGQPLEEDSLDVLDTSNLHASGLVFYAVSALANETSRDYDEVADSTYKLDGMRCSRVTSYKIYILFSLTLIFRESSGNKTRSTISIEGAIDSRVSLDDVLELKERITENEIKLDSLTNTNAQIMKILSTLQSSMEHMRVENTCLKDERLDKVDKTCKSPFGE
uniref:GIT_CC domain-containing protein n=1 Tax=Heterorhabditis bacteriophora TaxID=37862 RepID=A0A1I7WUM8_HETBA